MIRTTFFTFANRNYEMFVLPYIASALIHNEDARVEICLEDSNRFRDANAQGMRGLVRRYGDDRLLVRDVVSSKGIPPNSVRFLETPEAITEFTYIGDIDILIVERVSQWHIDRMVSASLPYSNTLRAGKRALTGLHFTRSDAYYPVSPPSDANLNLDEELLYMLVASRGVPLPPNEWNRPVHGYHFSPNRSPLNAIVNGKKTLGWGLNKSRKYFAAYEALQRNSIWQTMYPEFDRRYRLLLGLVDLALAKTFSFYQTDLHGQVTDLLTDARLIRSILKS